MLLQVLFCLFALHMLARHVPLLRKALRRDPERREGGALVPAINVVLALAILVAAFLTAAMKARWGDLIWK